MSNEIPKILWNFWIDFTKDKAEMLIDTLNINLPHNNINNLPLFVIPYVTLMHNVHHEWDKRLITSKDDLLYWLQNVNLKYNDIDENIKFVIKIINHSFINAAHKSDVVRYFLLKYYGGVWADATIIIFNPLDGLIEGKQLVLPYISISRAMKLIFGNKHSNICKYDGECIKLTDVDYNQLLYNNIEGKNVIMPENYFIASIANHYIINNVLEQLKSLWNGIIPSLLDKENTIEKLLTEYMQSIVYGEDKIFTDLTHVWMPTDQTKRNDIWCNTTKGVQSAYYLFNYIQLYKAIISECINENITEEDNYYENLKNLPLDNFETMYGTTCNTGLKAKDVCVNITLTCTKGPIYFFSAEYLRLFKNPDKTTKITFYDILIDTIYKDNVKGFKQFLIDNKIYMYKIGGIQKNKSTSLMDKIFKYYSCSNDGNSYKCNTKDLIKIHQKFITDQNAGRKRRTHKRRAHKRRVTKRSKLNKGRKTKRHIIK